MKRISLLFTLLLFVCASNMFAQINIGGTPISFDQSKNLTSIVPIQKMDKVDVATLIAEDLINDTRKDIPWRFGMNLLVDINMENSGIKETLADGSKLWRVVIEATNALSINLTFDKYRLPKGAMLWIYNTDHTQILGAFNEANNQADGYFATTLIEDSKITLEYYEPANSNFSGELHLYRVTHGYRSGHDFAKGLNTSGACEVNINCPDGADWQDQKRGACMLVTGGSGFCSGSLINNTNNDGTPYVLTANHCSTSNDFATWVFWFNWAAPTCVNPVTSPAHNDISGSVLKARNAGSDFCLVQMNSTPPAGYNVFYSGWSRETVAAPSATCIHHPDGDIMKISHSGALTSSTMSGAQTWRTAWTTAVTEPGSSGSPLFDNNHRIVGQLYGGPSSCSTVTYDEFGKFDVSWATGTTTATRLKEWLDPSNTLVTTLDGYDPNAIVVALDVQLQSIIQPTGTYTSLGNIVPTIKVKNGGTTDLTSFTAKYKIDAGAWVNYTFSGTLASGATVDVLFPQIALTLGDHTITANVDAPNGGTDLNLANNDKSGTYTVVDCGTAISTLPYNQDFAQGLPSCWENVDNGTSGQVWEFNNPGGTTFNSTTNANGFAILDSDNYGSGYSQNADMITSTFDFSNFTSINLKFEHYFKSYAASSATLSYSINNGSTWIQIQQFTVTGATNPVTFNQAVAAVAGQSQVKFKWNYIGTFGYYWCVDDIEITGVSSTNPNINVSTASLAFGNQVVSTTSAEQTYTVTGTNLTNDVTVTAPTGYQVSKTTLTGFATSITLTQTAGNVNATVYTNFTPTAIQAYNGNITNESAGATTKNLALTGAGVAVPVTYTISVAANPVAGGVVSGGGTYNANENCTVSAIANSNYSFDNWTDGTNIVSSNASYTFAVTSDLTLNANFTYISNVPQTETNKISIYPNPTKGLFNIEIKGAINKEIKVIVRDVTGTKITETRSKTIDLSKNASGMYFIQVISDGNIYNSEIIKQ